MVERNLDATTVARLKAAGAILPGKCNMDEFAMGSSTENSGYFTTRNPWDHDRIPGGSGGGSAAALAAFEAPLALGTDTGGSIRQPASVTGTVGVKPTYGGTSRYGVIAMASSLDQPGPCGRTVLDTALLHQVIAGWDPMDSTSVDAPVPDVVGAARAADVRGLRLGVVKELSGEGYAPGVAGVTLPPALARAYRIIVRTDIYNEVYEQDKEANNIAASPDTFSVTVPELTLGAATTTTLSAGEARLYTIRVGKNETLRVSLSSDEAGAANEMFIRYNALPSGSSFDAAFDSPLQASQSALLPSTEAATGTNGEGVYYVLVRQQNGPAQKNVSIKAETLPFQVSDRCDPLPS